GAQFWAAYVPVTTIDSGPHPAVYALEQIDLIKRLCAKYPRDLAMARTATDVERNFKAGKISCLIGIEGGHAIENSLGALRMFSRLGVRYMTLTHWETIDWADAATDSAKHNGLTPFGEDVVREMNRLGMLVDLAHVSDATMVDAIREATAPRATLQQVADHIEHIRDVAGVDHVGLGSDFDGITTVPVGLEDVAKFPDLLAELLRRGWSEQDMRKVAGLNVLRVLRD